MNGDRHHIEEALPRFSLNRRIGVLVLLASMVVVGLVAAESANEVVYSSCAARSWR